MTFNSGDTSKSFSLSAAADNVDDDGESVRLTFGTLPAGVTAGTTAASTVSITDNDLPAVTVSFGAAAYSVAEGSSVLVKVTLSAAPEQELTIPIAGSNQDGASNADYSGVPASVTFGAAETEQTFTVAATQDAVDDDGESVKLAFGTMPVQVTGGTTGEAVVSITDDDAPSSVAVSFAQDSYSVAEGSAVTITVQLDDDPEKTVAVPVSAAGENGASADDYSGVPASVVFNSGDTSKSFSLSAAADNVDDDGESVKLTFGTLPAGVTAGTTKESTVSITDDDVPAVTVSFEQAIYTVAEGSSVTVKVTLSADPERSVTIPLTATDNGGVSDSDYSGVPASVTFASGETEQSFTVAATQDTVDDDGESVKLAFGTLPAQVTGGTTDEAVVSITDDDAPASVAVSFGQSTYSVAEGSEVTITVQLDDDPEKTVTVPVSATGQNGASADDYSGVPASVTFNSGDTEQTFSFTAVADDVDDDGESVKLTFGTLPTGVTAGTTTSSTVSITDDDVPAGTVSLVLTPATIDEGGSSNVSTVTATLATASSADTTVTISAPQDAPVTLNSNKTLTIVKGATTSTGEVTITAVNDAVYTGDREVTVSGAASNEVGVANPEDATLTITDDEVRPVTVSFGSATYSVAEGGTVDVTVTLDAAPEREVTIPITATDQGGASADDYSGVPASVTFAAAETEKSFSVAAAADDVDDDGESVALAFGTLPAGFTAGTTNTATVSILLADASSSSILVSFSSSSYSATEGGNNAQVTVLLSSQPQSTVDIPLTATGASGATEDDWSGVPASLTFNPGDTSQTFTVIATDDDVEDNGEMVHLGLADLPDGFEAGEPATATITIMNDDTEQTPDSACPGAVWCATLTFSSEGSLHYDDHRQTFLGWHYEADSVSNTGATLSDSNFTYREKDYSFIGIWVFPAPRDRSSCTSELQLNIHSSDGLLADLDLFESLDASKGLKLIVDDDLEFPITVDTKRHPHMMGFLHPYFYSIRAGSTVKLRIEETDIASAGGDGAAGDALAKPRCVHVSSYPHNTPETGLVGLEITWQKPSLDGSPNILSGAANVDSYEVQWKIASDSWDTLDVVSEESSSNSLYHVILGLTEGVEYSVRVIATNGFGDSPPSEEATGAPTEVVRPELSTATVNGSTLTLAYDETLDATSAPEIDSFEVMAAGSMLDVNEATVEGSAVVLTLASAVAPDDEVELNYFPAWYIKEGRIQDEAGNIALGFVDQSVTNNTEAAQTQAAEEVTPLTASFSDAPGSHNGEDAFTFRIAFSEAIATSYEVVRDQSLEVTGGSVTQARRVDGRSDLWEITMEPGSNADVAVILRPDLACDAEGAICTADGKRLSNGLALLVPGPVVRQEPEPNRPATGSPTISGAVQVGETLRASTSGIADADGLDNAVFTYQWIAAGADIDGATGGTYTVVAVNEGETIRVRVAFTDDARNRETLTSAATAAVAGAPAEPLTVTLENTPGSHNGADAFTFELRFSEEVELSYRTLRDHSFTLTGGAVTKARRLDKPSNIRWEIHVVPDSSATVTVALPVTTDCNATGAICTEDGRMLSNRLELTVSGPGQ